ncbi:MAG TPA: hypothetical protein VFE23_20845 [Usitatibacter sp.]|jgi:hypothetical protein|nr:hypothetical protein [Usitatibacter sp.]
MRIYRLQTAILEQGGRFKVRVAAHLKSSPQGATISQERICDSKVSAEITKNLLSEQVNAAVRAIGGAIDLCATNPGC